jgi:Uncharacterised nucleotidyltransferase
VRRAGFIGDIWPDDIQQLLLQAALLPGDAGAAAWATVRPQIDIDRLPGELHRLMPALSKALVARGVDDPELARLKGVYQYSWYRNQLLFADGAELISALEGVGLSTMLLRGAAMTAAYHRDAGVRPMNDLDVLVTAGEADRARRAAQARGWRQVAGPQSLEDREAAATLRNDQSRVVRLHWRPSRNVWLAPEASEAIWQRGVEVVLNHTATRVPSPADHLVLACIDGARANSGSTLRWIADVTVLLGEVPELDWDVVVTEARRHHASLLVGEGLRYLAKVFEAKVPHEVIGALAAAPTTPRERLAHRLSLTTAPRMASAAELLGRFIRLTADLPVPRVVAAAPGFLQAMLGVQRRRDLPVAVARKAIRALVWPAPPLASLSVAGSPSAGQAPARRSPP